MDSTIAVAAAVGGYLIGSISAARIMAALLLRNEDVSGTDLTWGEDETGFRTDNVSATTIGQRKGRRYGCLTGSFDILKAFVPVLILNLAYPDQPYDVVWGIAVTAGHNLPIFYRFQGGRGTSTILGSLLAMYPLAIPITIFLGYLIGLGVFKDVLLAHHAGWIVILPFFFAAVGRWDLVAFAIAVNILRWAVSGPELREYWKLRKAGALQTEEFHDAIEQTHIGYIHKWLRERGLIHYDYMTR